MKPRGKLWVSYGVAEGRPRVYRGCGLLGGSGEGRGYLCEVDGGAEGLLEVDVVGLSTGCEASGPAFGNAKVKPLLKAKL